MHIHEAYAFHCVNSYILILWVRSFNFVDDAISRSLAFGCRHLCISVFWPTMRRSSIYVVPVHLLYRWRLTCKLHLVFWRRIYLVDAVLCTLAFRLRCTRTLVLYTTPYLVVWLLDVDIFTFVDFDRLWGDPAFTLCQCISSTGKRLSWDLHLVFWRRMYLFDGTLCTLALWCRH